jgi:acyl-CoA synthetase (AMP-forming)/AMP-acid ligase II
MPIPRIKELINRGGEKISPLEVDAILMACPGVGMAVCFAGSSENYGEEVYAAVVPKEGVTPVVTEGEVGTVLPYGTGSVYTLQYHTCSSVTHSCVYTQHDVHQRLHGRGCAQRRAQIISVCLLLRSYSPSGRVTPAKTSMIPRWFARCTFFFMWIYQSCW